MFFHKDSPKLQAFLIWSHRAFFGTLKFIFLVLINCAAAKGDATERARKRARNEGRNEYHVRPEPRDYR